ncbi:MAG: c-type cytochrome biogenesis protein CcmI [Nevskiaceae bacterium]|nr:MAG: c-type cytochrome biogenesis protein CcmI [Nevskiaceae bacterium]
MTMLLPMAVLAVLAAALLTRPWWRPAAARPRHRDANVVAYRSRLAEIDADAASGLIDAGIAENLRSELGARLLADAAAPEAAADAVAAGGRFAPWLLIALVVAFAGTWYGLAGSWKTQRTLDLVVAHPDQAQSLMVQAMVERLQQRLRKSPDDAEGWAMLGRSRFVMGQYAEAAQAYAKANALNPSQTADWLVGEGESLAMAHDHDLSGEPAALFEQALKLDPDAGKALWYAGLAAAQAQDYPQAMARWLRLRQQPLPPDLATALEQRLQELSQISGLKVPARTTVATAGLALQVKVALAPALASRVPPGATLFVFAKAAEGPPMPLAVQRLPVTQLPVEVTLDDSMAMAPTLKLSQFDRWVVTARISAGGTALPQSGDLQGQATVTRAQASKPLSLTIAEVVP